MEILIIIALIILNGIFAMAEIAIVSARKARLQQMVNKGDMGAAAALDLAKMPNTLLSTVQLGITFIAIFEGAFGGESLADKLAPKLETLKYIGPHSQGVSLFIIVVSITFASLVIGELVPKRIGLNNPEAIAKIMARPMQALSKLVSPLVKLLGFVTDGILRILQIKPSDEPTVSDEDVKMLVREGARMGIFDIAEKDIVERTLRLSDKKIATIMTSVKEVVWLDINSSFKKIRATIAKYPHSHFPVCRDSFQNLLGIARTKDLLTDYLVDEKIELAKSLHKPLYIPEHTEALKMLDEFKKSGIHMAFIVDEYGTVQGIVSLTDLLEEIVGEIPALDDIEKQEIIQREDGTWLIDGLVNLDEFKDHFKVAKLPGEKSGHFHTIGGFVMHRLERVPVAGDHFDWNKFRFEVMDMDGNRVDKILLKVNKKAAK